MKRLMRIGLNRLDREKSHWNRGSMKNRGGNFFITEEAIQCKLKHRGSNDIPPKADCRLVGL